MKLRGGEGGLQEFMDGALRITGAGLIPLGFQQITNLATAVHLTPPAGANMALIEAENTAMHWRDDGIAPTASIGMNLSAGTLLEYNGDLSAIQLIQNSVGATLNVSYYK